MVSNSKSGYIQTFIDILCKIYEKSKAYVSFDKTEESFSINRGVKQGDLLSPIFGTNI